MKLTLVRRVSLNHSKRALRALVGDELRKWAAEGSATLPGREPRRVKIKA